MFVRGPARQRVLIDFETARRNREYGLQVMPSLLRRRAEVRRLAAAETDRDKPIADVAHALHANPPPLNSGAYGGYGGHDVIGCARWRREQSGRDEEIDRR